MATNNALPFSETTSWSPSHKGRAAAIAQAFGVGVRDVRAACETIAQVKAHEPFTGHAFCSAAAGDGRHACIYVAGHSGPCRFARVLP